MDNQVGFIAGIKTTEKNKDVFTHTFALPTTSKTWQLRVLARQDDEVHLEFDTND